MANISLENDIIAVHHKYESDGYITHVYLGNKDFIGITVIENATKIKYNGQWSPINIKQITINSGCELESKQFYDILNYGLSGKENVEIKELVDTIKDTYTIEVNLINSLMNSKITKTFSLILYRVNENSILRVDEVLRNLSRKTTTLPELADKMKTIEQNVKKLNEVNIPAKLEELKNELKKELDNKLHREFEIVSDEVEDNYQELQKDIKENQKELCGDMINLRSEFMELYKNTDKQSLLIKNVAQELLEHIAYTSMLGIEDLPKLYTKVNEVYERVPTLQTQITKNYDELSHDYHEMEKEIIQLDNIIKLILENEKVSQRENEITNEKVNELCDSFNDLSEICDKMNEISVTLLDKINKSFSKIGLLQESHCKVIEFVKKEAATLKDFGIRLDAIADTSRESDMAIQRKLLEIHDKVKTPIDKHNDNDGKIKALEAKIDMLIKEKEMKQTISNVINVTVFTDNIRKNYPGGYIFKYIVDKKLPTTKLVVYANLSTFYGDGTFSPLIWNYGGQEVIGQTGGVYATSGGTITSMVVFDDHLTIGPQELNVRFAPGIIPFRVLNPGAGDSARYQGYQTCSVIKVEEISIV